MARCCALIIFPLVHLRTFRPRRSALKVTTALAALKFSYWKFTYSTSVNGVSEVGSELLHIKLIGPSAYLLIGREAYF